MKACPACGRLNDPDRKFCGGCGSSLSDKPAGIPNVPEGSPMAPQLVPGSVAGRGSLVSSVKLGLVLILLGFLAPALVGLLAACLGGCSPTGAEGDRTATLQDSLAGQWFPCEDRVEIPGGNADCRWVDDDGLTVGGAGGKLYSIDDVIPPDPADRDTTRIKIAYFDISLPSLVAYYDDSAAYVLKDDTLAYDVPDCDGCPPIHRKDVVSLSGDILTVKMQAAGYATRKFRKYRGAFRIVTPEEFQALVTGSPE